MKKNVIIYRCGENDDNDFEILNQLNKIERSSHPFIIFLSKNNQKEKYNEYIIENELKNKKFFFDILNIYTLSNEKEITEILWKIFNYYNQIDSDINNSNFISDKCLNIYLIGKPGTGKSSFVNEVFNEKKALENVGKNQTNKIMEYAFIGKLNLLGDKKGRINIFDTPGFSTKGVDLNIIKKKIKSIFSQCISDKDIIHCFLYFLDGRIKRTFDDNEIGLIKEIYYGQKKFFSDFSKILFIINFTNKTEDNDINSYKNLIHRNLSEAFKDFLDLKNKENIIEINLKRDIEQNRELKFGIDEIFDKMYNYFKHNKINIKEIQNIKNNNDNNGENRINNPEEILNRQIAILISSLFFKFYNRFEEYEKTFISLCEQKIHSAKLETQRIGLFIFSSDITRCERIRRNMFEYINDHFKVICCDIPFNEDDYCISEDERFSDCFILKRWFIMRENSPLITEQKGNRYLEKNKIQIVDNHNISSCILLANLYNNSVDLLNSIKNILKSNNDNENGNISFFKDINKAKLESILENSLIINDSKNIINDNISYINNNNYSSLNINDSIFPNLNDNKKKIEIINNYKKKEKNQFIIELNIEIQSPDISSSVEVVGKYYVFKIEVNDIELALEKSILEIQLEKEECKDIIKGNEKNKYIIIYDLRKEKKSKKSKKFE